MFYYGLPDLNYSLCFDDEIEILRSMVKLSLEWGDKFLLREFTKYVTDACAKTGNVPHITSYEEITSLAFCIDKTLGASWQRFIDAGEFDWKPDIDQIVRLMDSTVPADEAAEAYDIVYTEKSKPKRENAYLLGERLRLLCIDGNKRSTIEEFGLLRRIVREYILLYSESLETFDDSKKSDRAKIVDSARQTADAIMQCINVGTVAGRTLASINRASVVANIENFVEKCKTVASAEKHEFSSLDLERFYYDGIERCGGEVINKTLGRTVHLPEFEKRKG